MSEETLTNAASEAAEEKRKRLAETFDELKDALNTGKDIEVVPVEVIRSGFKVMYKDVPATLPFRSYSANRGLTEEEASAVLNKPLLVRVEEVVDEGIKRVRVSHRKSVEAELWKSLSEGQQVTGKVRNIIPNGLFLDINGLDAFVHISNLSDERVDDIKSFINVGDELTGKITELDSKRNRISVSCRTSEGRKRSEPNWAEFYATHNVGDKVTGVVRNIISNGVFVEFEKGIDGFIRMGEVSWLRRDADLQAIFHIGKEVETEIVEIDTNKNRISLSYRKLIPDNWLENADKYEVGQKYTAQVIAIPTNDKGCVLLLDNTIEGFMPKQRMTALYDGKKPKFKRGDDLEVILLDKSEERHSLLFESAIKPENPFESSNRPERERKERGFTPKQAKPAVNTVSNLSFASLLSDSSKDAIKKLK